MDELVARLLGFGVGLCRFDELFFCELWLAVLSMRVRHMCCCCWILARRPSGCDDETRGTLTCEGLCAGRWRCRACVLVGWHRQSAAEAYVLPCCFLGRHAVANLASYALTGHAVTPPQTEGLLAPRPLMSSAKRLPWPRMSSPGMCVRLAPQQALLLARSSWLSGQSALAGPRLGAYAAWTVSPRQHRCARLGLRRPAQSLLSGWLVVGARPGDTLDPLLHLGHFAEDPRSAEACQISRCLIVCDAGDVACGPPCVAVPLSSGRSLWISLVLLASQAHGRAMSRRCLHLVSLVGSACSRFAHEPPSTHPAPAQQLSSRALSPPPPLAGCAEGVRSSRGIVRGSRRRRRSRPRLARGRAGAGVEGRAGAMESLGVRSHTLGCLNHSPHMLVLPNRFIDSGPTSCCVLPSSSYLQSMESVPWQSAPLVRLGHQRELL